MKIADGIYVLSIPRDSQGAGGFLNLTLILDDQNGATLVDTGLPGQDEAIGAALTEAGIGVRDIKRIIFTHQDLDHIGSGAALVRQSGAQVLAHPADAPHIEGSLRPSSPRQRCSNEGRRCARPWSVSNPSESTSTWRTATAST
jgi:glyoxylase-like metal-dependent hydrolase (beta-lactamase superfamily II)